MEPTPQLENLEPSPEPQPAPPPAPAPPNTPQRTEMQYIRTPVVPRDGDEPLLEDHPLEKPQPDPEPVPPEPAPAPEDDGSSDPFLQAILAGAGRAKAEKAALPAKLAAPPDKPAPAPEPKIEVVKRKPIDANTVADAVERGIRAATEAAAAKASPTAPPTQSEVVDTANWSEEDRDEYDLITFGENFDPEKYQGAAAKFAAGQKKVMEYIAQSSDEDPETVREMTGKLRPGLTRKQRDRLFAAQVTREVVEKEMLPQIAEAKFQTAMLKAELKIERAETRVNAKFDALSRTKEGDDDALVMALEATGRDTNKLIASKAYAIERDQLVRQHANARIMAQEFIKITEGVAKLDDKNPAHAGLAELLNDAAAAMPEAAKVKDGKRWVPRGQYDQMADDQKANHWRWETNDVLDIIAVQTKRRINLASKMQREHIRKESEKIRFSTDSADNGNGSPNLTVQNAPVIAPTRSPQPSPGQQTVRNTDPFLATIIDRARSA